MWVWLLHVCLDADLPDGTGPDLLLEMRSQGLTTPVVFLTGSQSEQGALEVMEAGGVNTLPKEKLQIGPAYSLPAYSLPAYSPRAALRFYEAQAKNKPCCKRPWRTFRPMTVRWPRLRAAW